MDRHLIVYQCYVFLCHLYFMSDVIRPTSFFWSVKKQVIWLVFDECS
jgi:hypothetical protein